jgi:hypothetical protein
MPLDPVAGAGKPAEHYAAPKRAGYSPRAGRQPGLTSLTAPTPRPEVRAADVRPAKGTLSEPDDGPAVAGSGLHSVPIISPGGAASLPADAVDDDLSDSLSAEELAKLYAPARPASASPAPLPPSMPGVRPAKPARANAPMPTKRPPGTRAVRPNHRLAWIGRAKAPGSGGVSGRPNRRQVGEEAPRGPILRRPRLDNWTAKAAVGLVLIALIGGAGAVVMLESFPASESEPAKPGEAGGLIARKAATTRNLTVAARTPASNVEVIHADDAGDGLAPAEGSPLPGSAKIIPLPQAVPAVRDPSLRRTRDAASGVVDVGVPAAGDRKGAAAAVPGDGAPAADAGDPQADGGDGPAVPPPRSPKERPDRDAASAAGALAYAPASEPIDHGAKALASKGGSKDAKAAAGPDAGAAQVTSWVNMRASADNKAATVKVLQAGSVVTIVECKFWCEIVADGKRGFVYKHFLKPTGQSATAE